MADQTNPNGQPDPTRTFQYQVGITVGILLGLHLGAISGFLMGTGTGYLLSYLVEGVFDVSVDKWAIALGAGIVLALVSGHLLGKKLGRALGLGWVAFFIPLIRLE